MNERIKLLAVEAGAVYSNDHAVSLLDDEIEKFAELIVQKCAQIAKKVDGDEGDDYKSGRTWAGIDVLKHFGVEE